MAHQEDLSPRMRGEHLAHALRKLLADIRHAVAQGIVGYGVQIAHARPLKTAADGKPTAGRMVEPMHEDYRRTGIGLALTWAWPIHAWPQA